MAISIDTTRQHLPNNQYFRICPTAKTDLMLTITLLKCQFFPFHTKFIKQIYYNVYLSLFSQGKYYSVFSLRKYYKFVCKFSFYILFVLVDELIIILSIRLLIGLL